MDLISVRVALRDFWMQWNQIYRERRREVWITSTVVICVVLGAILRLWGMPGAMLYSIDQARDYRVAAIVLEEGIGSLPLLGARAGGTDFRLGPMHNYFHLPGLWLTGVQEPYGMLLVEALCSIGLIVLVYFLIRGVFSDVVSTIITAHVAFGIIFVSLARFTWNPNAAPFFVTVLILAAWCLLDADRKKKQRLILAAVLGASGAILMQLHTIAFVIVPLTMIIWQIRFRVLKSAGEWALAIGVIAFIFIPVLLSEYLTQWALTKAFFTEGGGRIDSWLELLKSMYKMMYDLVWYSSVMFMGHHPLPEIARIESAKSMGALMKVNKELTVLLAVSTIVFVGILSAMWRWIGPLPVILRQRWHMLAVLIGTSLVIITPLSLKASDTRYFHIIYFLPLLMYAFILSWMFKQKYLRWLGYMGAGILLASSLFFSWQFVSVTSNYQTEYHPEFTIQALESYYVANMNQYEMISDFVQETFEERGAKFLYLDAPTHEERALSVTLKYRHQLARSPFRKGALNSEGLFILVRRTEEIQKGKKLAKNYSERYEVVEERTFGTLTVIVLEPKSGVPLMQLTDDQEAEYKEDRDYDTPYCEPDINARCRLKDIIR